MEGLYRKYIIHKSDGSEVNPNAQYFVLRIDKDAHARKALRVYADSARDENLVFANDIYNWLKKYE